MKSIFIKSIIQKVFKITYRNHSEISLQIRLRCFPASNFHPLPIITFLFILIDIAVRTVVFINIYYI